jgi:hypothetical protein
LTEPAHCFDAFEQTCAGEPGGHRGRCRANLPKVGSSVVACRVLVIWSFLPNRLILLARPRGFEPLTFAFGGQRSEPAYTDAGAPLAFARSGEQGGSRKSIPSTSPSSRKFYRAPSSSVLRAPIPAIAANTTGGVGPPPYRRKARARHHRHKHDRLCSDSPICRCPFPWRQNEGRAAVPGRGPWSATNCYQRREFDLKAAA